MTKRFISPNDTSEGEPLLELRLTLDSLSSNFKVPPSVEKLFPYFIENLRDNPSLPTIRDEVLPALESLIQRYPNIPILYNYLIVALELLDEDEKLLEILEEQYRRNPNYFFARMNYARYFLQREHTKPIPDILDNKFTLQDLYPQRKEFHFSEAVSFSGFMALYQDILGYPAASQAWLSLASAIEPKHPEIRYITEVIQERSKKRFSPKVVKSKVVKSKRNVEKEHFPPSMLLVFMTPEQELIDFLNPLLPIPCSLTPRTLEELKKQGVFFPAKSQMSIISVLDMGDLGGVVCFIEHPQSASDEKALSISITHLIIKPKHKAEIRVQDYQRKRNAMLKRQHNERNER